jgi:Holliday junction resolvasome RuvABC DNA-binding subunit
MRFELLFKTSTVKERVDIAQMIAHQLEKVGIPIATTATGDEAEVISVLTNLGYTAAEASKALSTLPTDQKLSLEDKIKQALQYLGAR